MGDARPYSAGVEGVTIDTPRRLTPSTLHRHLQQTIGREQLPSYDWNSHSPTGTAVGNPSLTPSLGLLRATPRSITHRRGNTAGEPLPPANHRLGTQPNIEPVVRLQPTIGG